MAKLTVWEHLFFFHSLMRYADSMFTIRVCMCVCVELAVSCSSCAVISAVYWPSDDSTWVSFLLSMNTPGTCVTAIFHNVLYMKCTSPLQYQDNGGYLSCWVRGCQDTVVYTDISARTRWQDDCVAVKGKKMTWLKASRASWGKRKEKLGCWDASDPDVVIYKVPADPQKHQWSRV